MLSAALHSANKGMSLPYRNKGDRLSGYNGNCVALR